LRDSRDQLDQLHHSEISQVERLAILGEITAAQIHEVRNRIGAIAGWLEIAGRDLPGTSPARAALQDAGLEIAHMHHLCANLLQAARPRPPEVCPSDLNTTVKRVAGRL